MTVHREITRVHVLREAYLVIHTGLARLARKAGLVGSFIFEMEEMGSVLDCAPPPTE